MWKYAFFEADDEDDAKFEPLRIVERHERDRRLRVVHGVDVGDERDLFEELTQQLDPVGMLGDIVVVRNAFLFEFGRDRNQFGQIFETALAFDRVLGSELGAVARHLPGCFDRGTKSAGVEFGTDIRHDLVEGLDTASWPRANLGYRADIGHDLADADASRVGGRLKFADRTVADAPSRHVDDAP